jgi:hypothetical protein
MSRLLFLFVFCVVTACGSDDIEKDALVRVYDKYLLKSEVRKMVPYGITGKDSAALVKEYIDQWVLRNLVLKRAELNLRDEEKDVSRQLEDYRASLIIFAYERELIRQKLDTVVAEREIEKYYLENPANFELKSNIIKLKYIKIPMKAPNADKAKNWLKGNTPADQKRLEQYCGLYAVNYLLDDSNWLLFDDVLKELPLINYSSDQYLGNKRFLELQDKDFKYLVAVTGFMVKESQAPLSFERNSIRNIILNKRKIKLVQQMQQDAYTNALNENDIELLKSTNE